ncbi:MAG TPA: phosphatidylglycerophosphatase A [Phycisphaerae bacterium]|nr:phosphatidylglycerophosphatase A [Phycisphaerae bacterium]
MMRRLWMSGFGLGYAPMASGTFGSAGALAIALLLWAAVYYGAGCACPLWLNACWVVMTLLACTGCVVWGPWAAEYYSGRCRKPGDPGQVVLDEWAGQWLALVALPMTTLEGALAVLAVQFFFFRLFDVLKLSPGRRLEKLPGGWGILLDDLSAGIYANLVGQVVFRWLAVF